jgi:hypothetical protein
MSSYAARRVWSGVLFLAVTLSSTRADLVLSDFSLSRPIKVMAA